MQRMTHWDDPSGAIHEIASRSIQHPAQSHAQGVSEGTKTATNQQQQKQDAGSQTYFGRTWPNPYADIVGGGPFAQNQASYTTPKDKKSKKRDFTPYFEATDPRNHADLQSPNKYSFLGTKDVNQKLHQDTTDAIKIATEKRDKTKTDKPLPLLPSSAPQTPKKDNAMEQKFQMPTSPKWPKSRPSSSGKSTETHYTKLLDAIVEAPSPLNITNKRRQAQQSVGRTPTIDRVLQLRAEEQAKTLANLEGEILGHKAAGDSPQDIPRELIKRVSDSESQYLPRVTSREQKRHASEFISGLNVSSQNEREGMCLMADAAVAAKDEDASSSVYSSDGSDQEDEIERLTKAIAGIRPFQDLPCPSPTRKEFKRKSAVPAGLDMSKIIARKEGSEDGKGTRQSQGEPRERTLLEAEADLLKLLNATGEDTGTGSAAIGTSQSDSSTESFAMASSEDYEQIGADGELVTEQNGVKRRWYKGFRKV
jgi:hypothetical protein